MSDQIKDGGPAFPQHDLSGYGLGPPMSGVDPSDEYSGRYEVSGMSLRDWFAGQALKWVGHGEWFHQDPKSAAERAYKMADAMLAAREAKP